MEVDHYQNGSRSKDWGGRQGIKDENKASEDGQVPVPTSRRDEKIVYRMTVQQKQKKGWASREKCNREVSKGKRMKKQLRSIYTCINLPQRMHF